MWRKMRKPLLAFVIIAVIVLSPLIASAPIHRKSLRQQLNPNYVRAMSAYKRLGTRLPYEELRAITIIGILNGAKQTEAQIEKNLIAGLRDLLLNTPIKAGDSVVPKMEQIAKQLARDQRALDVLTAAMDLAMKTKSSDDFRSDMQRLLKDVRRQSTVTEPSSVEPTSHGQLDTNDAVLAKMSHLRQSILQQVDTMKSTLDAKIDHTLEYLIEEADNDGLLAKASNKVLRKRDVLSEGVAVEVPAEVRLIDAMLNEQDFRHNLIDDDRFVKRADNGDNIVNNAVDDDDEDDDLLLRGENKSQKVNDSSGDTNVTSSTTTNAMITTMTTELTLNANQEEAASSESIGTDADSGAAAGGGGGLVGIIASLSGGEGGSDVGALIGALTGVISTLFGPGGLDIESLLLTGTSLISGLLAGNKNFGTVLGNYVGTAFDGLSGGGGAINNGQFIGNFLGTVVASLSADPEEDDVPPRPLIFAQNLISSFMEAKNRKASSEELSAERKDTARHGDSGAGNKAGASGVGGSDSGAFIKHIASHLVSSIVSVILNASVGASGGASHASSSLFAHSSGGAHKPAGGAAAIKFG